MPIVTAITRQVKNGAFYSISIDGEFRFSVSDLVLSDSQLEIGLELDEQQITYFQAAGQSSKAYNQALNYLSTRARSTMEIKKYLLGRDYSEQVTSLTIDRLIGAGLLNDQDFAKQWLASRANNQPKSRRMLEQELQQKGIDSQIIQDVLSEEHCLYGDKLAIINLIQKKHLLQRYPEQNKLISYLQRQGFSYADIKQATSELANT